MTLADNLHLFRKISDTITIFTALLTFTLLVGWIIYFIRECWRLHKEYKTCKQTPLLHPLYSGVQYLSQQRKLYNLKTHIVKYVLMIVCSSVEVSVIICTLLSSLSKSILKIHFNITNTQKEIFPLNITQRSSLTYYKYLFFIPMQSLSVLLPTLLLTLISILSRYLAARYLNHPFRRTLIKYIIWCSVQCLLTALCSTVYTWLLMVLVFPSIGLINWILLLRDTSLLSRVLRSNLREIQFHSNNRILYHNQLSAYKFYRIFRIALLISMFLIILSISGYVVSKLLEVLFFANNKLELHHNVIIAPFLRRDRQDLFENITTIMLFVWEFCIFIYLNLTSIPLCCISFAPVIVRCVKRCREKEDQYRYNYEKLEPLIRKYL